MAGKTYAAHRYRINRADPLARVVERNLKEVISESSDDQMVKNLKKYGKDIKPRSYKETITKSSLDTRTFIRFMLAAGLKEFTIKVTDEELLKIEEYEKNKK